MAREKKLQPGIIGWGGVLLRHRASLFPGPSPCSRRCRGPRKEMSKSRKSSCYVHLPEVNYHREGKAKALSSDDQSWMATSSRDFTHLYRRPMQLKPAEPSRIRLWIDIVHFFAASFRGVFTTLGVDMTINLLNSITPPASYPPSESPRPVMHSLTRHPETS